MSRPPRLVERTVLATFLTVAVILLVTFVVIIVETRERIRTAEIAKLELGAHLFTELDARRQSDQLAMVSTLSETPTLKAALETYTSELRFGSIGPDLATQLRQTVRNEIDKLAARSKADVIAILGTDGQPFAVAGGRRDRWSVEQRIETDPTADSFQRVIVQPGGAFHAYGARLRLVDEREGLDQTIGVLLLATSLDANYAQDLSDLSNAGIVISVEGRVTARTVAEPVARALVEHRGTINRTTSLNGEEYAVSTLLDSDGTRIYTLSSVDAAARTASRDALVSLGTVAFGSFALALIASVWVSRTLTRPIDRLATDIEQMSATRDFNRAIEPTRTSRELDSLANAFNDLVGALSIAEAETRSTYLGAIQALAAALDARDPYTAGHSERVSRLSVLIAQQFGLPEPQVDVIRLGALLHDIGKIGVPDDILRKPGPLTALEFEQIKRHPTLGARILRQVPFLAPHLPIVELHHESPDGRGYPFGLRGDEIPLDARIVHVADAFDAMTSVRAYRPARPASLALAELHLHAGTQFDLDVVRALHAAMPSAAALSDVQLQEMVGRGA
jgi:putative nucleotidyltransferase with HDIG domain